MKLPKRRNFIFYDLGDGKVQKNNFMYQNSSDRHHKTVVLTYYLIIYPQTLLILTP